jgi:DNA transformation protein
MNTMSEFVDNLEAVFVLFGPVEARRMFGGYGIYHDDLMFGLVADDVLYLKTDEKSVTAFTELGLSPFEYEKHGKKLKMSYYLAPEEIFDDPEQAKAWADRAFEAALRSRKPKRRGGVKNE